MLTCYVYISRYQEAYTVYAPWDENNLQYRDFKLAISCMYSRYACFSICTSSTISLVIGLQIILCNKWLILQNWQYNVVYLFWRHKTYQKWGFLHVGTLALYVNKTNRYNAVVSIEIHDIVSTKPCIHIMYGETIPLQSYLLCVRKI